jgi:hypothetical protein
MHFGVFYPMPEEDMESRLADCTAEISDLKKDVRELVHLVEYLASFVEMPASGTEEERVALEFESRLGAILEKHSRRLHQTKHKNAIEGELLG